MPLLWITYFFFLLCRPGSGSGSPNKCDEVRKLFQLTQIGAGQSLPVSPRAESDLQVCASKHLTCCTKKMEEKYQLAARRDIQNLLQTSSSSLKFLISRNVAALQDTFEVLVKQAENHTNVFLRQSYRSLADEVRRPRAGTLHRHRSLPDGVRAQHRRVGAAVLRRPLPARLRPPRRPGSRRPCPWASPSA
ncbi:hypothetical protein fugu_003270 [Takifugu bimaculatus]|uniref:Uncharacterized protein n=1 Tax=Takifugu bimaculatus TaxID=433685 RepID=A0A4Z2BF00_9TELE|nr:hypothetical protein fugu_003270 [Takifugu bimaculatus]